MQLKIKLLLLFLILYFTSYAHMKNMKTEVKLKSILSMRNGAEKKSTKNLKVDSNSEKNQQDVFNMEDFNYNYAQAYSLFKELSNNLFNIKDINILNQCRDEITSHSIGEVYKFKSLWNAMSEINNQNNLKRMYESQSSPSMLDKVKSLTKLIDWKNILLKEFLFLINNMTSNDYIKNQCLNLFSDTQRNIYDLLSILNDQKFFGGRFYTTNKDLFMDSMYSIHRNKLPADAFKKLNLASEGLMAFNNENLRNIAAKRSYTPIVHKKPSPYTSNYSVDYSKINLRLKNVNARQFSAPNTNLKNNEYSLIIFGDIGQIEFFNQNAFKVKNPPKEKVDAWYNNVLLKEKYNLDDFKCKVKYTDVSGQEVEVDLLSQKGLVHFSDIIKNKEVKSLIEKTNGFVLLGDVIYPEMKYLNINDGKLDHMDKWLERLKCGWNLFFRSLESIGIVKVVPKSILLSDNSNKEAEYLINNDAEILAGNHSYDIDLNEEEKFIKNLKSISNQYGYDSIEKDTFGLSTNKAMTFTYTPKFITITYSNFKIQFLDFNSQILYCLKPTEEEYKKCAKYSPSVMPYSDVLDYVARLDEAIDKFIADTPNYKIWRIMRAHHPPLNTEDGDSTFYFEDLKLKNKTVNFYKKMKEKTVNIFFGSHVHNSQVIAYPYSRTYKSVDPKCTEGTDEKYGCYKIEENVFNKSPIYNNVCNDNIWYNLPIRDMTDTSTSNDMLYIFITGNSGRFFDSLREGKKTDGILIWSRAVKTENEFVYGFTYSRFMRDSVEITYYEVSKSSSYPIKAASFSVKSGKIPDAKQLDDFLNSKCASR